jgi:hypothetical protein
MVGTCMDIVTTLTARDDVGNELADCDNVTVTICDMGEEYAIQEITIPTPEEAKPYLIIARDHPLFWILETCADRQHLESCMQRISENAV